MESIGQVIAANHGERPEVWLADPDQYEQNGRILRDSTSPRLLAYSPGATMLYVTDGCNSCSHALDATLESMTEEQFQQFAAKTGIRLDLLRLLSAHSSD
jgi:hypothetical protein